MSKKIPLLISLDIGHQQCRCAIFERHPRTNTISLLKCGSEKSNQALNNDGSANETLLQESLHNCIESCKLPIDKTKCQIICNLPIAHQSTTDNISASEQFFKNEEQFHNPEQKKHPLLHNKAYKKLQKQIQHCCDIYTDETVTFFYEGFSISHELINPDLREQGALLVDIGKYTSKIQQIKNNKITHFTTIPIGGHHITKDLSICLKTSIENAEKLKILNGNLSEKLQSPHFNIDNQTFDTQLIKNIISARVIEWMRFINDINSELPLILCGGGSLLKNQPSYLEKKYKRRIYMLNTKEEKQNIHFAGLLSNANYAIKKNAIPPLKSKENKLQKWLQNWL